MTIRTFFAKFPRWSRLLLAGAAVLALLYGVLGFLVAPAVVKARLPRELSRTLGREVTLERVRINPFALSATLEGFRIADRDGGAFFGWDRLYVNLQASSLVTGAMTFKTIEWVRPFGKVVVFKGGQFNFSDIVDRLAAPGPKPAPAGRPMGLHVAHLAIQGAQLVLQDRSLAEPFATTLGPLSLALDGFHTEPDSRNPYAFTGRTEAGETFSWTGQFSLEPLQSTGSFALERLSLPKYQPYYRDQVAFDLREGQFSARAGYAFHWGEGTHVLKLTGGSAELVNLKLGAPGGREPALELPETTVKGLEADLVARTLGLASVAFRDGRVAVTREKNGAISLVRLLTPKPQPRPKEPAAPFQVSLKELGLKNFRVAFEDRASVRPVPVLVEALDATLRDFTLDPAGSARLTAAMKVNGKAGLSAEGTLMPFQPSVDLQVKVDGLDLAPFDPYLAPAMDIRLNRGTLSAAGRVRGTFAGKPSDFAAYQGDLRLDGFEAMDGAQREPFLRYRTFRMTGMDLRTQPSTLTIRAVDLTGPEGRLVVSADGTTNVARALKLEPAPAASGTVAGAALPPTQPPAFALAVGKVALASGRLTFIDRSLTPNAALLLTDLEGAYTSLSTRPDTQSALELKGKAGGLAPLAIHGRAKVLRQDQDTDVTLRIQGSELSDFSPYAGKYLGYSIHKGKLDVDAHIRIQERRLDTLVKTRLDQFYLGEKTQSPDATRLPVKLGLAVLRDRKGVIDLELPVQGSLDDPDFRYGRLVWNAILNVFGKILASPFTLLGKLAGAGDSDLSFVAFPAGLAVPDPEGAAKLQALARALEERPALSLEAEGVADPATDGPALRKLALERLLQATRDHAAGAKPSPESPSVALTAAERPRWLKAAHDAAFPPPPAVKGQQPLPAPPLAEMEQRLLGSLELPPGELLQLADARTKAVLRFLQEAKVDPARLFEVEGGEKARKTGGSRVYLGLR